jgi:hypothetical protein
MNLQSLREVNPFFCEELVLHLHKITESISTMSTISTFAYFAKRMYCNHVSPPMIEVSPPHYTRSRNGGSICSKVEISKHAV